MDNLEKIDVIRDRLGVSYAKAKEALEAADGDVVEALVNLEEELGKNGETEKHFNFKESSINVKGQELVDKIKEIVKEGNVNKIVVKNQDKTLVEIPVTAGVVSLVLFPYITLLAGMAAMFKEYTLEIEKEKKDNNMQDLKED